MRNFWENLRIFLQIGTAESQRGAGKKKPADLGGHWFKLKKA